MSPLVVSGEHWGLWSWLVVAGAIALVALAALAGARRPTRARDARARGRSHQAWTITPGEHLAAERAPAGSFLLLSGGPARLLIGETPVTVEEGGVLRLTTEQRAQLVGPVGAAATLWLASEAEGGRERRRARAPRRSSA